MEPLPTLAPYAHINDSSDEEEAEECVPAVLQVNQLFQRYEEGLGLVGQDDEKSVNILSEILEHPLALKSREMSPKVSEPIYYRAKHLYRASLKVLGSLFAQKKNSALRALTLWREAVILEPLDVALWYKIGKLALEVGQNQLAWYAFERGLSISPKHAPMLEKFMECCLDLDDLFTCQSIAARLVKICPGNKRAQVLLNLLMSNSLGKENDGIHGRKRQADEEILHPRIKRKSVTNSTVVNTGWPVKSFPIAMFSWSSVAEVIATAINTAPFELEENEPAEDTEYPAGSVAVINVYVPNTISGSIICPQSTTEPESNIETSQPEADDQSEEACKGPAEVTIDLDLFQSRQSHRPKRKLLKDKPVGSGNYMNSNKQNVMELLSNALGCDVWDKLVHATVDKKQNSVSEGLIVDKNLDKDLEDLNNIRNFILNLRGCSVMEAASTLLEERMAHIQTLEEKEALHILAIDSAMHPWFEASPHCSLALAELHMDAIVDAVAGEDRCIGKESPRDMRKHVECCNEHLSQLHRISVESALGITNTMNILLEKEASLRFQWTQARLFWFEKDFSNAEKEFRRCLSTCEALGSEVYLPNCLHDNIIKTNAILKKLSQLEVIAKLDRVEAFLLKGMHSEVMGALSPLLLQREGNQGSAQLMLTGDQLLRGLQALKEAALHVDDQETVLLAHLRLLEVVLPGTHLPQSAKDMRMHASESDTPPPVLAGNIALPVSFRPRFTEVEEFVGFCSDHLNMLRNCHNFSKPALESIAELVKTAFAKALHHMEWCYWRIVVPLPDSTQEVRRLKALHNAAGLVFCLHQVHPLFHNDEASLHNLCSCLLSLLRDRSAVILSLKNGVKYNITVRLFAGVVSSMIRDDNEQEEGYWASPNMSVQLLSHCLESLYGLKLCPRKQTSITTAAVDKDERDTMSVQDALDVWGYVEPYLSKLAEQDSDQFESCEELLTKLAEVIPPPPEELLVKIGPDKLLNAGDRADALTEPPQWMCPEFPARLEFLEGLKFRSIYESLYYWAGLSTVKDALDITGIEGILSSKGTEILEQQVRILKLDLIFNPERTWTWEALAIAYKEATNAMLECGARELPPSAFLESIELVERLDYMLQSQKRCFMMLYLLAKKFDLDDEQASAQDMLAEIYYCRVQKCPPLHYKAIEGTAQLGDFQESCEKAFFWWKASRSIFQDEWSFPYYMGKMIWKLKGDSYAEEAMDYFAHSVHLANLHEGGLVDPIHKLHSVRLKLLIGGCTKWALLTKYMFDPIKVSADDTPKSEQDTAKVILADCREALEYCRGKVGFYHRVHYHLALAYFSKGNYEGANSHIRQLFVQGKKQFCLSLTRIDPDAFSGGKKRSTQCKSRRTSPTGDSNRSTPAEDCPVSHWGTRPPAISGPGMEEPHRKFAGAIRKYLMLYMKVLFCLGDLDTLEAAAKALQSGKVEGAQELRSEALGTHVFLDDMGQKALGVYLLSLHQNLCNVFPPQLAKSVTELSQRRDQKVPLLEVPEGYIKGLQHAYNAVCELTVEPENDWSEAIEVAVRDVLPSGAMSNPTDSSTICKDLPAYAAAFVVLLEQKNDIESLEGLALAFRKRGAKQGCRSLHSLSPMRTLANRVCQSAMNLIEHKLIVAREDYLKRSFITEAHQQLLSKGITQLVSIGKGLDQTLCGPLRDEFGALCGQFYGLQCKAQGRVNDVDPSSVRLSYLLRRCEEAASRVRPGESKKLGNRRPPPYGILPGPILPQVSTVLPVRSDEVTQALAPAMPPVPITPLVVPGLPSGLSPTNKNLPTNVITPTAMEHQVGDALKNDVIAEPAEKNPTPEGQESKEGSFAASFSHFFQSGVGSEQ